MSSWGSRSAFAGWTLMPLHCQAVLMLILVHVRYHGAAKALMPLHPVFSRDGNRGENSGNMWNSTTWAWLDLLQCAQRRRTCRGPSRKDSVLLVLLYIWPPKYSQHPSSLLKDKPTTMYVILKLGSLILLKVWMGKTTQSINKSKAMEASRMYQQRQLKNNPSVVFFSEKNGIFSSSNLTEVRMLSCLLHQETWEEILTSLQCHPAPTDSSRHLSILTEHLYKANAKLFWQKSPK